MPLQTLAQYMRPQEDHYGKSLRSIGNYKLAEKRMDQDQAQFDDRHLLEYKKYLLAGAQLTMDQQDAIFKVRDRYVDKFGAGMDEASYPGWYAALENDLTEINPKAGRAIMDGLPKTYEDQGDVPGAKRMFDAYQKAHPVKHPVKAEKTAGQIEREVKADELRAKASDKSADASLIRANKDTGADHHADTQKNRMRRHLAKAYGASEFASLDKETGNKVMEAARRANKYMDDGMGFDDAAVKAKAEVDALDTAMKDVPKANPGAVFNNKEETIEKIKNFTTAGGTPDQALDLLEEQGWDDKDAMDIMNKAGITQSASYEFIPGKGLVPK